jgi:hypothetical protein
MVALLALAAILVVPAAPSGAGTDDEAAFVTMINDLRTAHGLNRLTVDRELTAQARHWSEVMASNDRLEHAGDLAAGITADWDVLGENVGVHTVHDLDGLFQAFVASPPHLDNLLDPRFDYVGVGVTTTASGKVWTTHRFMSVPAPVAPPPDLAPVAPGPVQPPPPDSTPAPAPSPPPAPATPAPAPRPAPTPKVPTPAPVPAPDGTGPPSASSPAGSAPGSGAQPTSVAPAADPGSRPAPSTQPGASPAPTPLPAGATTAAPTTPVRVIMTSVGDPAARPTTVIVVTLPSFYDEGVDRRLIELMLRELSVAGI